MSVTALTLRQSRTISLPIVLLGCGFLATLIINWPGHIGYDAVIQLSEGRSGAYSNWHPAIMSWLLGLFDAIWPGAGLFVVFNSSLLFGSFVALAAIAPKPHTWVPAVVALLCVLTPQMLIYPGIVWKDGLFAGLAVASFACITLAGHWWRHADRHVPLAFAGLGLVLAALATLTRQNGVIALVGASVALGWVAARQEARRASLRKVLVYASCAAVVAGAVALAGFVLLSTRMVGHSGTIAQVRTLQFYDVVGAVAANPTISLDEIRRSDPSAEQNIRSDGVRLYSPQNNDPLTEAPAFGSVLDHPSSPMVARQWTSLVLSHPLLYLKVRSDVFRWTFAPPGGKICVAEELGVTTDLPDETKALGLASRWDARDVALESYTEAFVGTPVLSHVTYFLIACGATIFLLRRRRTTDIVIAMMLISAVAFVASFFVISIACDYRYLLFLDMSVLIAMFHIALTTPQSGQTRREIL